MAILVRYWFSSLVKCRYCNSLWCAIIFAESVRKFLDS
ncbi:MAG: DUF1360 domain-containing protein [Trichodesmium sp.]